MIRILIADDHTLFREGLKQIFAEQGDLVVAAEASNGKEVISKIQHAECDIIILDISMPGRNGLEVIKQIKAIKPEQNILVLSMYNEEQYALRSLRAGASGYLTKSGASQELITAIRKISSGRKYISPSVAEQLAFELASDSEMLPHSTLSNREYQVMVMIASGKTVGEIAKDLALSVSTISTLRARVLRKMAMKTNAQITHYAVKNGLTD